MFYTVISKKQPPYVNRFHGKPAITEFDKPFTPTHHSSQGFATPTSSAFCLVMGRSLGFGSYLCNYDSCDTPSFFESSLHK